MCPKLRAELIRDEGLKLVAYKDTNGYWTVGVGHLLGREQRMTKITEREAFALLAVDVEDATKLVTEVFGSAIVTKLDCPCDHRVCDTDKARLRGLINMAFNRGGHMKTSTTITPAIKKALLDGDWSPVRPLIMASEWASQIGTRAGRIADLLEGRDDD